MPNICECLYLVGSLLPLVEGNGLFMLKNMDLIFPYEAAKAELLSDGMSLFICCLWIFVVIVIIWSLLVEVKATNDFWKKSAKCLKNYDEEQIEIVKNLPPRVEPRKVDRRHSSIVTKSNPDPIDQV